MYNSIAIDLWSASISPPPGIQHSPCLQHLAYSTVHAHNTQHTAQYVLTTHSIHHSTCLQHTPCSTVHVYNTWHTAHYMITTYGIQHSMCLQYTAYSTVRTYNTRHTFYDKQNNLHSPSTSNIQKFSEKFSGTFPDNVEIGHVPLWHVSTLASERLCSMTDAALCNHRLQNPTKSNKSK